MNPNDSSYNATEGNITCKTIKEKEYIKHKQHLDLRQEIEMEFIVAFKNHPELWDPSHVFYTNKVIRQKSLTELLPYLKKLKPMAVLDDVRRKINSIRSNYRRELRKVEAAKTSGDVYTCKRWSFQHLSFLSELDKTYQVTKDERYFDEKSQCSNGSSDDGESTSMPKSTTHSPSSPKRIKLESNRDPLNEISYTFSPTTCNYMPNYVPILQEWSNILERLDPLQRIYAKKAINDVLFEAELGNLRRDSIKIN